MCNNNCFSFLDILFLSSSISIFQSSSLQSIKIGVAPNLITANAFEIIVKLGIITSSPFFIPTAFNAISKAAVPLETATEYFLFINLENFSQIFLPQVHPKKSIPFFITFETLFMSDCVTFGILTG